MTRSTGSGQALLLVAAAWLLGVAVGALGYDEVWPLLPLAGLGAAAGFLLARAGPSALLALVCGLVALLGVARYETERPPDGPWGVALHVGGEVVVHGTVVSEPEPRGGSQRFQLAATAVRDGDAGEWQATTGRLLVYTRPLPRIEYGDRLELRGAVELPPRLEGFDYQDYLARQGVAATIAFPRVERLGTGGGSALTRALIDLRRPFSAGLTTALAEPAASLARGILLGERASIPPELTDDLNRAGISHLVAISGYNVTLLAGLVVGGLAALVGRRNAILVAIGIIVFYALLVGAAPSVLRAAVMGVILLGAWLAGRPASAGSAIAAAAALLTLWQPLAIEDVAFQLSFAATLGLVYLAGPLAAAIERPLYRSYLRPVAVWLGESLGVTLAASIAVLPIIAANFGRLSLAALPANALAVPLFPFILLASLVTAVVGALAPSLATGVGRVTVLPLSLFAWLGETFASLPGATLEIGDFGRAEALLTYLVVIGAVVWLRRHLREDEAEVPARTRLRPALVFSAVIALAAVALWWANLSGDDGRLRLSVLDVGQGDAILIEAAAGQRLLIDGGPSGPALMQALGRELATDERQIDLVVLTHAQDDHLTGLVELLERYRVEGVLAGPLAGESAAYRAWRDGVAERGIPTSIATAGEWIDLGPGARIEVLAPGPRPLVGTEDDLNNNSVVLRLVYGDVSFLLTGDLAAAGEAALLERPGELASTVLKVGHHGAYGSTTTRFLEAVRPAVAAISVGAENGFGHPSPTTLLRLAGLPVLSTAENGRLRFATDGETLEVEVERGSYRVVAPLAAR